MQVNVSFVSRPVRTKRFAVSSILCGALVLLIQLSTSSARAVTVSWNPTSSTNAVGYKIYYGTASHAYTAAVTEGNVTNAALSGLTAGATYYFAATSYDSAGNESSFSSEVAYTIPTGTSSLTLPIRSGGQFSFTVSGATGSQYIVQASTNLVNWVSVQTNTAPFNFVDTAAGSFRQRFYRTISVP